MHNLIVNHTATGAWQEMPNIPNRTRTITIQARTSAVVQYRFRGQTTYWTVKADTVHSIPGEYWQGNLELYAAAGVIVELQYSTQLTI